MLEQQKERMIKGVFELPDKEPALPSLVLELVDHLDEQRDGD